MIELVQFYVAAARVSATLSAGIAGLIATVALTRAVLHIDFSSDRCTKYPDAIVQNNYGPSSSDMIRMASNCVWPTALGYC